MATIFDWLHLPNAERDAIINWKIDAAIERGTLPGGASACRDALDAIHSALDVAFSDIARVLHGKHPRPMAGRTKPYLYAPTNCPPDMSDAEESINSALWIDQNNIVVRDERGDANYYLHQLSFPNAVAVLAHWMRKQRASDEVAILDHPDAEDL